jgi:hypothetical protein
MNKMSKKQFPPFSIYTALRQFRPRFAWGVYGVFDFEEFTEFFHSTFVLFVGKRLSDIIVIKCSSNSIGDLLEKVRHFLGKKTARIYFDII